MTEAGLAKVIEAKRNGQWDNTGAQRPIPDVPAALVQALAGKRMAKRRFEALAPSYRKQSSGGLPVPNATRRATNVSARPCGY
jgi:uncharacterized protein YdeI (YjbR/CyaY-like superfamily)